MFAESLKYIEKYNRIIIHRHSNPDGDALGSQIGLREIIRDNYPDKEVYIVGDGAGRYSFMDGSKMDEIPDDCYAGALAIILDTSAEALISDGRYKLADMTVRYDHHISNARVADEEFCDTSFESCAGLITAFAMTNGLAVSESAAKALYTGMVTDSGRFRYDSTTPRTFQLASFLMERNSHLSEIYKGLYADDFKMIRLRASYVLKIKFSEANVAYIYTTRDELKELDFDFFTISRGMVGTMSDIRGVDIWANFTENDEGVVCEIRSNKYNINPVAVKYGGGGHAKASGATLKDKDEAMRLLSDLDAIVKEGKNNE